MWNVFCSWCERVGRCLSLICWEYSVRLWPQPRTLNVSTLKLADQVSLVTVLSSAEHGDGVQESNIREVLVHQHRTLGSSCCYLANVQVLESSIRRRWTGRTKIAPCIGLQPLEYLCWVPWSVIRCALVALRCRSGGWHWFHQWVTCFCQEWSGQPWTSRMKWAKLEKPSSLRAPCYAKVCMSCVPRIVEAIFAKVPFVPSREWYPRILVQASCSLTCAYPKGLRPVPCYSLGIMHDSQKVTLESSFKNHLVQV